MCLTRHDIDGLIPLRRELGLCSAAVHDACMFFFCVGVNGTVTLSVSALS